MAYVLRESSFLLRLSSTTRWMGPNCPSAIFLMWTSSSRSRSFPLLMLLEFFLLRILERRSLFFLITSYISPPIKVYTSSILISPRILFSPMIISSIICWFFFILIIYSDPITSPLDLIMDPVAYLVINDGLLGRYRVYNTSFNDDINTANLLPLHIDLCTLSPHCRISVISNLC
jgi:hypothetical protein